VGRWPGVLPVREGRRRVSPDGRSKSDSLSQITIELTASPQRPLRAAEVTESERMRQDASMVRTWGAAVQRPYEEMNRGKTRGSKREKSTGRSACATGYVAGGSCTARRPTCRGGMWAPMPSAAEAALLCASYVTAEACLRQAGRALTKNTLRRSVAKTGGGVNPPLQVPRNGERGARPVSRPATTQAC
jgi:hypothetical protein